VIGLPQDLRAAVRREFDRTFTRPFTDPAVVVVNALLVCGAWLLLPVSAQDFLFTLHGPSAFAMVMAGWMYADVPATNVLASDAEYAAAALDDPEEIGRLLVAKNIVLWCLVTPFCTIVALVIGLLNQTWPPTVLSVVLIVTVPAGALGIAAWLGIVLPYHPIPLRDRWADREHRPRKLVRWMLAVLLPYAVVPFVAVVILLPSLLVWHLVSPHGLVHHLPTTHFALGIAIAAAMSAGAWIFGHKVALRMIRLRHDRLAAYLADPSLG
jgi:hypothetical protein